MKVTLDTPMRNAWSMYKISMYTLYTYIWFYLLMIDVWISTVPTKKNLVATSHRPFQPTYSVLMITCKWFLLNLSLPPPSWTLIIAIWKIHTSFLRWSTNVTLQRVRPLSDPGWCSWLTNKHQKIIHPLLFLERENPFDNSSSRMILQNCSSGCCESTTILNPSFCLVSFYSTHLSCLF